MKSPLLYLLETLFCSGLLMAFYRLLLVRKVSFAWCRRYLVAAVVLSVVLPALEIPVYSARTVIYPLPLIGWTEPVAGEVPAEVFVAGELPQEPASPAAWQRIGRQLLAGAYLGVVALFVGAFVGRIVMIARLRRRARRTDCGEYVLAEHPSVGTPFSFLRTIFLGDGYEGRRRAIVLSHEASHVRHRHSRERIAVEAVRCLCWFNPFVWMAGRWLAEVHEWEADRDVLDAGYDLTEYRIVLFNQLFGYNPDIACGLNHSLTKKRFSMMTTFRKRRYAAWRLGAALPVVAGLTMLCSFTVRTAAADEHGHVSTIRIARDGVYLNGERRSMADIETFVAEERAKLSEAEQAGWTVRLTNEAGKETARRSAAAGSQGRRLTLFIGADCSVSLDDDRKSLSFSELESRLQEFRASLCAEERSRACVCIAAAPQAPLELISAVKEVLRRESLLRVEYASGEQRVDHLLAPAAANGIQVVTEVVAVADDADPAAYPGKIAVRERNLLRVLVSGSGQVTAGTPGREQLIAAEALPALVERFVMQGADTRTVAFERGGAAVNYPVSEGLVSLVTTCDTPYGAYVEAQRQLERGFRQARAAWAERETGIPYAELSEADRQLFERVVPVKIVEEPTRKLPGR